MTRLWLDGCLDFFHYGHGRALLQAKKLGSSLVVGVHSDEEVTHHKGVPVMNLAERCLAASCCKWVDQVVPYAPYVTELPWLDKYDCDYVVHGDDVTTDANGEDCYRIAKAANRFKLVKRTEGISTTELLQRILVPSSNPLSVSNVQSGLEKYRSMLTEFAAGCDGKTIESDIFVRMENGTLEHIVTGDLMNKAGLKGEILYIDGEWNLVTKTHLDFLKQCKEQFPTLPIVAGIFSNENCSQQPFLDLFQRSMNILQCKFVDAVIINAPKVNGLNQIRENLKLSKVHVPIPNFQSNDVTLTDTEIGNGPRPYDTDGTNQIIQRVQLRRKEYEERQLRKLGKHEFERLMKN
ncbi:ethanolamine-phosphate cytidylyltransferase [Schizosaccharomyces japonicus yFS275]|uniref:ethanolamine-phosphate cytidylyltransferase n=1 Tax=Schizosaccharomyces japonicus (strain yFS275 / FY16936) TaxID=402676 RepID=B6K7C0_SCHJY|nr:ethanolamine-phosphate cytidylyltransferase [Schizosaccharomyces japonicus yFS275]EEB09424.1 ethanolamine-phosphate cytidylyltransferase [Schizosaccharomyces japonicus yFS275]